jgi:UDP-N-acetylglucosamine:LPS N-acetylglucosamine transferase
VDAEGDAGVGHHATAGGTESDGQRQASWRRDEQPGEDRHERRGANHVATRKGERVGTVEVLDERSLGPGTLGQQLDPEADEVADERQSDERSGGQLPADQRGQGERGHQHDPDPDVAEGVDRPDHGGKGIDAEGQRGEHIGLPRRDWQEPCPDREQGEGEQRRERQPGKSSAVLRAAVAVGLAAAVRRRPLVLQEQNAYAGATNKLLARFATRIFIAFEAARAEFPAEKTDLAGNPVRAELTKADRVQARAHFGLDPDGVVLLVMGGSLGAGPINDAVRASVEGVFADEHVSIIWQTGTRYFEQLQAQVPRRPRLRLLPYLDRMDYAYAAADLALCRAGAITFSELAATGTPSILVPSPNVTADHQTRNARAMSEAGAAVLLPETRLGAELADIVRRLAGDAAARREMREAALRMARPDAARTIAEAVLALARPVEER